MGRLMLFEEYKNLLLEIGDQSAQPFKWKAKEDAGKEMINNLVNKYGKKMHPYNEVTQQGSYR